MVRGFQGIGGSSIAATKLGAILESGGNIAETYPLLRQVLSQSQRKALVADSRQLSPDGMTDPYVSMLQEAFARSDLQDPLAQISYAEARTYMHDVLLRDTDQMSMAHSLEVRVPLSGPQVGGVRDRFAGYLQAFQWPCQTTTGEQSRGITALRGHP